MSTWSTEKPGSLLIQEGMTAVQGYLKKIIEQGGSETTHISNQSNRENGNRVDYFSFPVNNLT